MNTRASEADREAEAAEVLSVAAPSWEQHVEQGHVRTLVLTVREMWDRPRQTFEGMPTANGLSTPLLFAVFAGTLSSLTVFFAWFWFSHNPRGHMGWPDTATFSVWVGMLEYRPQGIVILAAFWTLSPVLCAIWIFLLAGVCHLRLMSLGSAHRGFEATFRVVSYAASIGFLYISLPATIPVIEVLLFMLQCAFSSEEIDPGRIATFPGLIASPAGLLYILGFWVLGARGVGRFSACVSQGLTVTHGVGESKAKTAVRPAKILSYTMVFGGYYLFILFDLLV